jgi:type I restriction enzyme R subunit
VVGGIRRAQGLRYAVVDTPEMRWLTWKELSDIEHPLDRALTQLCSKPRLLERVHAFIVFDAGVKKTATHNQYFGVKAAQERVQQREGGKCHTRSSVTSAARTFNRRARRARR